MDSSLETTEKVAAKGALAPRVSLASMEEKVLARVFLTGAEAMGAASFSINADITNPLNIEAQLKPLTICLLVMRNGFTIIGKSAPASPANFDAEKGRQFAYEDAIRQLWPLEGYALREALRAPIHPDGSKVA